MTGEKEAEKVSESFWSHILA